MPKPQNNPVTLPSNAKNKINQEIFQQSFLGASITNFSVNLGLNSQPSTLNVSLVEDDKFLRNPNAVKEGYHPWDTQAFPLELYDAERSTGVKVGQPCAPNCVTDIRPWENCDCAAINASSRRVVDEVPDYLQNGDYFFKPRAGAPVYFNYRLREWGVTHPNHKPPPATGADQYDYQDSSIFEFNGIIKNVKKDYSERGITYQVEVVDPRVVLEDTIVLLGERFINPVAPADIDYPDAVEGFYDGNDLISGYSGTEPANTRDIPNMRAMEKGYSGYYNILNVFGYYEFSQFRPDIDGFADLTPTASDYLAPPGGIFEELGNSGANPNGRFGNAEMKEAGMVWYDPDVKIDPPFGCDPGGTWGGAALGLSGTPFEKQEFGILPALNFMLMGGDECYKRANEPMGGPSYYVTDNRNTFSPDDEPVVIAGRGRTSDRKEGPYRYKVDLTDLYNLHKVKNPPSKIPGSQRPWGGGNLDSSLRINENHVSLLSLIQTICEAAGADFFVELIRDPEPGSVTPFAGIAYNNWYGPSRVAAPTVQDSTYAGIIKVWAIPRNQADKIVPHIVSDSIDDALVKRSPTAWWTEEQFKWDGTSLGYSEPIIRNTNVGYEYNDVYTGVFMLGGPRTRVVGVTPLGKRKPRYDEYVDKDGDGIPDEWPMEYLPSTELDGASLGYVTGSQPIDTYDERGKARARGGICLTPEGHEAPGTQRGYPATCTGQCDDPAHTTEAACIAAGKKWEKWTYTLGWSSDEYRAWQNHFHPFDDDEGIIKADMGRLNEAARGNCTPHADASEESDENNHNGDESCEGIDFGGNCYACLDGAGDVIAGRSSKVSCDTPPASPLGTWTKIDESSRVNCAAWTDSSGNRGAVWLSNSFEEGDGYIDLYPMWGWSISDQQLINTPSDGFVKNTTRGNPIKGAFNDDDPYRDFDSEDGIYSNKEFFDRYEGKCSSVHIPSPSNLNFHNIGYKDSRHEMDTCLYDTVTIVENGEKRKKKVATGYSYTLFCHDPYGRKEVVMTSSQEGSCTGMTCPDTDPECDPESKLCCEKLGGSWVRTGNAIVTAEEVDVTFSRCTFHDEPDPYNFITGMRQAQEGGCINTDHNNKQDCDENAKCEPYHVDPSTAAPAGVSGLTAGECANEGTCVKIEVDPSTGADVESEVTAGDEQGCRDYCCREHAGDNTCKTRWEPHKWTGWNPGTGDLVRPDTATIPINLHLAGFIHGPSGEDILVDGVAENHYLATVTELRHAATSQDAWFKYMRNYDSWLPCKMEWKECIMNDSTQGGLKHAMEAFFGVGRPEYPAIPPVLKPSESGDTSVDEHNEGVPFLCKGTRADLTPEEHKKMEKNFSWRVVNEVATKYYGRTYLMQLPFAPPLEVGCSASPTCQCCKDENGNLHTGLITVAGNSVDVSTRAGCEEKAKSVTAIFESPCEDGGKPIDNETDCVNFTATWNKYNSISDCEDDGHKWSTYGIQSEWQAVVSKKDGEVIIVDNRWDIASAGWPFNDVGVCVDTTNLQELIEIRRLNDCYIYGIDNNVTVEWIEDEPRINSKENLRYPANQNFWNSDGNLEAFVAFPNTEIQRLSHQPHKLSFREFNPETYIEQFYSDIAGDASQDGTVFVKASVDPKIYWLPEISYIETLTNESEKKECFKDGEPMADPYYAIDPPPKSKAECLALNTVGSANHEWKGRSVRSSFLKPYALISIEGGAARYDLPDTYNDKRAQLFPDGEEFDDNCDAGDRIPYCDTGAGIAKRDHNDPTWGTPELCLDNGGTWVDKVARHECQTGPDSEGCHWETAVCIERSTDKVVDRPKDECLAPLFAWISGGRCTADNVTPAGSGYCEDSVTGRVVRVHPATSVPILDKAACEAIPMHTWVDTSGRKLVQGTSLCIPLTKVGDSRTADAYLKAALNNYFHHPVHMRMGADINKAPMVSAAFKPYYAGVPMESRIYYWGPWSKGKDWGKILYINDSSYHPGIFGAESEMAFAARAKCLADVDQFKINQETERGSVTLDGPPFYDLGTHVSFGTLPIPARIPPHLQALYAVGPPATPYFGPIITDMSVDVGPDGMSTTYNMQLQPKFGNLQEIQEQRIREQAKQIRDIRTKQEEDLRRSRLPDPQQFRSNYRG